MIDPTPLLRANSLSPRKAALTDVNISGVVVPSETTVAPTITVDIPSDRASATAEVTVLSAPKTSPAMPTRQSPQRSQTGRPSSQASNHVDHSAPRTIMKRSQQFAQRVLAAAG